MTDGTSGRTTWSITSVSYTHLDVYKRQVVLLTIVTCGIYGIYWAYKQGEKLDFTKNNRGIPSSNSGVLYLILQIFGFGIIAYALMQNELNKLA